MKFTVGDAVSFLRGHDRIRAGSSGHVTACYISSRVVQVTCPPIECGQPGALTLDVPTDKLALDESSASASMRGLLRTTRPVA